MRIRKVIGFDPITGRAELGDYYLCCWADCMKFGDDRYEVRADGGTNPHTGQPVTLHYVFCSNGHKMFYVNSHRDLGQLPAGYKPAHGLLRY